MKATLMEIDGVSFWSVLADIGIPCPLEKPKLPEYGFMIDARPAVVAFVCTRAYEGKFVAGLCRRPFQACLLRTVDDLGKYDLYSYEVAVKRPDDAPNKTPKSSDYPGYESYEIEVAPGNALEIHQDGAGCLTFLARYEHDPHDHSDSLFLAKTEVVCRLDLESGVVTTLESGGEWSISPTLFGLEKNKHQPGDGARIGDTLIRMLVEHIQSCGTSEPVVVPLSTD